MESAPLEDIMGPEELMMFLTDLSAPHPLVTIPVHISVSMVNSSTNPGKSGIVGGVVVYFVDFFTSTHSVNSGKNSGRSHGFFEDIMGTSS